MDSRWSNKGHFSADGTRIATEPGHHGKDAFGRYPPRGTPLHAMSFMERENTQ